MQHIWNGIPFVVPDIGETFSVPETVLSCPHKSLWNEALCKVRKLEGWYRNYYCHTMSQGILSGFPLLSSLHIFLFIP